MKTTTITTTKVMTAKNKITSEGIHIFIVLVLMVAALLSTVI